jgi:dienelactone hydrolase
MATPSRYPVAARAHSVECVVQRARPWAPSEKTYEVEIYPGAGHGFLRAQADREGANRRATERAWPRTIAFLQAASGEVAPGGDMRRGARNGGKVGRAR